MSAVGARHRLVIVAPLPGALRVVTQTDHAALAADILRLWRADGLPETPHRDDLLVATREHDNGWREADAAPRSRDDGRPHDFRSMPAEHRIELWHRGIERHAERPRVAVWIAEHAVALHRPREGRARGGSEWAEALDAWTARRDALLEASGFERATLERDYRFLDLADTISLAACAGWTQRVEHRGVVLEPRRKQDEEQQNEGLITTLALHPFPLAGATTFEVDARTIEDRAYDGDADLAVHLATARRWRLRIRLVELRESLSLS